MNHRELLSAIADLEPAAVEGEFLRHSSLRVDPLAPSGAGGRWGAPSAYPVLYLGRPVESVVIEAYRHLVDDEMDAGDDLAAHVLERRISTLQVNVGRVLDLREPGRRERLKLPDPDLFSEVGAYARCQAIGAAAHQLELQGILAPAATRAGETLALFDANISAEEWPSLMTTDIWRELPADPRLEQRLDSEAG